MNLQLARQDLDQIQQAREAFKDWQAADLESPECAKTYARWERMKLKLALLLMHRADSAEIAR